MFCFVLEYVSVFVRASNTVIAHVTKSTWGGHEGFGSFLHITVYPQRPAGRRPWKNAAIGWLLLNCLACFYYTTQDHPQWAAPALLSCQSGNALGPCPQAILGKHFSQSRSGFVSG